MTIGMVTVACLAARVTVAPVVMITSTLSCTSSVATAARRSSRPFCRSLLKNYVFPFHITKLAQTLPERLISQRGTTTQKSDPGEFRRLLRLGKMDAR